MRSRSRLESENRPKKQTFCKRKVRTRSNIHAVHDGQRS